jgi:hypothetical protein
MNIKEMGHNIVYCVNMRGLEEFFHVRQNDRIWKTIDCIQSNVRTTTGVGIPIIVNFFAPVNKSRPDDLIHYDVWEQEDNPKAWDDVNLFKTDKH